MGLFFQGCQWKGEMKASVVRVCVFWVLGFRGGIVLCLGALGGGCLWEDELQANGCGV